MFHRLFIANRGEVAARVARTAEALGIVPVFGVSEADQNAPYVQGRETVLLGPARASESYLKLERVVGAAKEARCTALHPGWGFLSENAQFARLVEQHGITFVGPPAHVMHLMGTKTPAKRAMAAAGLEVIPGSDGPVDDLTEARSLAESLGYPVLVKAEAGGGGRGMRIAQNASEFDAAYGDARAEARAAFGNDRVYLERLMVGARHVEIQILADRYGHAVHLGERDCTIQRNHQKLIEESGSPALDETERQRALAGAVQAAKDIGYVGAGTMEMLLDSEGTLRFMEMNTRLQVEHCVSEERTGVDLVEQQLQVAAGAPLALAQDEVVLQGHAIECRINAEDPTDGFRPSPGEITGWKVPEGPGVRVDTHVAEGYTVPPFYDSLIAKVITHGKDREEATSRMLKALGEFQCDGVHTTIPMHRAILASAEFKDGRYDIGQVPGWKEK